MVSKKNTDFFAEEDQSDPQGQIEDFGSKQKRGRFGGGGGSGSGSKTLILCIIIALVFSLVISFLMVKELGASKTTQNAAITDINDLYGKFSALNASELKISDVTSILSPYAKMSDLGAYAKMSDISSATSPLETTATANSNLAGVNSQLAVINGSINNILNQSAYSHITIVTGNCTVFIGTPLNVSIASGSDKTFGITDNTTVTLTANASYGVFSNWIINGIPVTGSSISLNISGDKFIQAISSVPLPPVPPTITETLTMSNISSTLWLAGCIAVDSGNYSVNYSWTSSTGSFVLMTNNGSAILSIPAVGTFHIMCNVSDGMGGINSSSITVINGSI